MFSRGHIVASSLPTLSNDRYSTYNMQHARKKPDIKISTVVLWGWNQPNDWKHMKSSWRKINAPAGSAAESFAPCYYYCNFLLLLCCDPLDRAEHGAYIVRLVYVYVALLKRDKTCTRTLLNWSFLRAIHQIYSNAVMHNGEGWRWRWIERSRRWRVWWGWRVAEEPTQL